MEFPLRAGTGARCACRRQQEPRLTGWSANWSNWPLQVEGAMRLFLCHTFMIRRADCASGCWTLAEDIILEWEQRKKSRAGGGAPCESRKTCVICDSTHDQASLHLHEFRNKLTAAGAPAMFNFYVCSLLSQGLLFCSLYSLPEQLFFSGYSNFLGCCPEKFCLSGDTNFLGSCLSVSALMLSLVFSLYFTECC